jgi:hypothetical protein
MDVISRAEAKAAGLRWYFTGAPCPNGHVAKRSVSNRECRGCVDARHRARRAIDPEPYRKRERARYGDRRREQCRASYARNIEKRHAYESTRNADPVRHESIVRRSREYAKRHRGKKNALTAKRRALRRKATPRWLTRDQLAEMRAMYVEASAREGEWEVDHIVPIRSKVVCGLHVPWNLRIIPKVENRRKSNRLID